MPYSVAARDDAVDAAVPATIYISLHSADPGSTGANEISGGSPAYARVECTTGTSSGGSKVGSEVTLNMPAGTVTHYGAWSSASGSTGFLGAWPLPNGGSVYGDQGTVTLRAVFSEAGL